jgi:hypothetical protein
MEPGIVDPTETYITLEEIVNPILEYTGDYEPNFWADNFREIQPPMEITIESFIPESQTV